MVKSYFYRFFIFTSLLVVIPFISQRVIAAEVPEIYIQNIDLPKTEYQAGDTVQGTFLISNGNTSLNTPNIMYHISLVGDYGTNDLAKTTYDTQVFGPVFLDAKQQNKLISFTYKLPQAVAGKNLGIQIRAFLQDGTPLGWNDQKITVTGGMSFATIKNAAVVLDGQAFSVGAGPAIYQGKQATLSLGFSNPASESLTFTPHIKIYKNVNSGTPVKEYNDNPITVAAKGTVQVSLQIPTLDYTPGVYVGDVAFLDQSGIARAVPAFFRYIIGGDTATIQSITTNAKVLQKNSPLQLTMNYSGAPYDILTGASTGKGNADLSIKVFNESDKIVALYNKPFDFNEGQTATLALSSSGDAKAMRVEAVATKDGKELARYTSVLTKNYDEVKKQASANGESSAQEKNMSLNYVIGVLAVIVVVGIIISLIMRRRSSRPIVPMVLFLALVAGGLLFGSKAQALTTVETHDYHYVWNYIWVYGLQTNPSNTAWQPGYHPNPNPYPSNEFRPWFMGEHFGVSYVPDIKISFPNPVTALKPGQQFYVKGSTYAEACKNNGQDMEVFVTFKGNTKSQLFTDTNSLDIYSHILENGQTQNFSIGPFTAPTTPGTYSVRIKVNNYLNVPDRIKNKTFRLNNTYKAPAPGSKYTAPVPPSSFDFDSTFDTQGGVNVVDQTFTVVSDAPTVNITASPNPVDYNSPTTLTWTVSNATSCTATGGWSGTKSATGGSEQSQNLTTSKTFTITCTNSSGSASDSVTVNIKNKLPAPKVTLTANPTSVNYGATSNLTWTVTGYDASDVPTCTASGGWSGSRGLSGSEETGSITANTTFTLTCTNKGGKASDDAVVNVIDAGAPDVTLNASPNPVNYNNPTTLTWSVSNATSCLASGGWTGQKSVSGGSQQSTNLTAQTTFYLECSNSGPTKTKKFVVVGITGGPGGGGSPVNVTLTANPTQVSSGDSSTLTWTITNNATSCTKSGDWSGTLTGSPYVANGSLQISNITSVKSYTMTCTGADGSTDTDTATIIVDGNLGTAAVSCEPVNASGARITSARINTPVYWRASVTKGQAPYSFTWEGTDMNAQTYSGINQSSHTRQTTYDKKGKKYATVIVEDANGKKSDPTTCEIPLNIKDPPIFIEV